MRKAEILETLEKIYAGYPRQEGKSPGMKILQREKWTIALFNSLDLAVEHYANTCKAKGRSGDYILLWSSFASQWHDWTDPTHGAASDFSTKPNPQHEAAW